MLGYTHSLLCFFTRQETLAWRETIIGKENTCSTKRKYPEDSSDESDSDHQLSQTEKTNNDLPSDSDESLESTPVKSKITSVASRLSSLSSTPVKSKPTSVACRLSSLSSTPKPTSVASRLSALKAKAAALSDEPQILSPEKVSHPVIIILCIRLYKIIKRCMRVK